MFKIISIERHFINDIKEEKFREYKEQMLLKMQRFLKASNCRRNILLKHFEEEDESEDDMLAQKGGLTGVPVIKGPMKFSIGSYKDRGNRTELVTTLPKNGNIFFFQFKFAHN